MSVLIVGIDEAGRGPLAGPVSAAAVILNEKTPIAGLMDSKKLSAKKRDTLYNDIIGNAYAYGIGLASADEIDQINILQASLLAMQRAVANLPCTPVQALVDGIHGPKLHCPVKCIINGDQLEPAISAASILAKVTRDRIMVEYDQQYPGYGLAQHKGYPTKAHCQALSDLGVTPIHRKCFKPVREVLERI